MDIVRILFFEGVETTSSWKGGAKNLLINLIRLRIILLIGLQCSGQNNDFLKYFRIFFFSDSFTKNPEGVGG
jgi:hypothetical protein